MLENGKLAILNMRDILPNRFQPRIHFNEQKLSELSDSIRKYGLIQPIVVRQIGTKYEIIAGERRYKASVLANKETIPAIIVNLSDRDSEEIALLENIQREDLSPIEEAVSYKKILDIGYITQEELAKKIGKSQSFIANKLRLLNLDDIVQEALLYGKISERHARSLLKIHNNDDQINMLHRIMNERLTVKMADREIRKLLEVKKDNIKTNSNNEIETLVIKKNEKATPVSSHKIIKVNPPKEMLDKFNEQKNRKDVQNMDIDKILEQAQDINQEQTVKPANDIADLMKENPNTTVSPIIKSEPKPEPEPMPEISENNKFVNYNVANSNNTTIPVEVNNDLNSDNVSFDSVFKQNPMQTNQSIINQNESPQILQNSSSQPILNQSESINQSFNSNINNKNLDNNINNTQNLSVPNFEANSNISANPNLMGNNNLSSNNPFSSEANELPQQNLNSQTNNVQNQINEQANSTIMNNNIVNNSSNIQANPNLDTRISNNQMTNSINSQTNSIPVLSLEKEMNVPDSNIIESDNIQKDIPSSNDNVVKFRQVINLIRNCANEIEKMGYYVNLDEIDLENKYQVTFNINKE